LPRTLIGSGRKFAVLKPATLGLLSTDIGSAKENDVLPNLVPQIENASGQSFSFDAQLTVGDNTVNVAVAVDDNGLSLTTKKDTVHFPRSTWLDVAVTNNSLVVVVYGFGYDRWTAKRKFESKNPGQEFTDYQPAPSSYVLTFNPKKLPSGITPAVIQQQFKRTYLLAYLDEVESPTIVACPDCKSMMDVTPYQPEDNLFCSNCSRVIGVVDEPYRGICDSCQYYTQLVENKKEVAETGSITTSRICHPCRVQQTIAAFVMALGIAIVIGIVNIATIYFGNRFFPVLILIGGASLLWSLFSLLKVIIYSAAQKATGGSPLVTATTALRKGKTDKALEIIGQLDGDMTGNPGILMNLSRGLTNAGDFEKADQFADVMIANFPNFQFGYVEKMKARAALGADEQEMNDLVQQTIDVGARNAVRSPRRAALMMQTG
jgi:hypothetical protein